jgi:hypothetical protein
MNPPPILSNPPDSQADSDLKQLAGFHFLYAATGLAFVVFPLFANLFLSFTVPDFWKNMPPGENHASILFLPVFLSFYGISLVLLLIFLNFLSGYCLWRRKDRRVSFIVAGLNCLFIPWGTAFGIFAFKLLKRPAVKDLYQSSFDAPPMKAAYRQFKAAGSHLGIWR